MVPVRTDNGHKKRLEAVKRAFQNAGGERKGEWLKKRVLMLVAVLLASPATIANALQPPDIGVHLVAKGELRSTS